MRITIEKGKTLQDALERHNHQHISDQADAERYDKLRAWMVGNDYFRKGSFIVLRETVLCGPTFDAAVDALPQPAREENIPTSQESEQEKCIQTFYAALSDMTHSDQPFSAKEVLDAAAKAIRTNRTGDALPQPLPTASELTGSDPDFTGSLSTDEYIDDIRGHSAPERDA